MFRGLWNYLGSELRALSQAPVTLLALLLATTAGAAIITRSLYLGAAENSALELHQAELERDDYRRKLRASPDEARAHLDALSQEVKALRARVEPRLLTSAQRDGLKDHIRPSAAGFDLRIDYDDACPDCGQFAAQIGEALRRTPGWNVEEETLSSGQAKPAHGLGILVHDPLRPPIEADMLRNALQLAGLEVDVLSPGPAGEVHLLVSGR